MRSTISTAQVQARQHLSPQGAGRTRQQEGSCRLALPDLNGDQREGPTLADFVLSPLPDHLTGRQLRGDLHPCTSPCSPASPACPQEKPEARKSVAFSSLLSKGFMKITNLKDNIGTISAQHIIIQLYKDFKSNLRDKQ